MTVISTNEAVVSSHIEIIKSYTTYTKHIIRYIKTVNFGLVEEVMMTLINPSTGLVEVKAIFYYNKETKKSEVISV